MRDWFAAFRAAPQSELSIENTLGHLGQLGQHALTSCTEMVSPASQVSQVDCEAPGTPGTNLVGPFATFDEADWQEWFEERAAIYEYEGELPREEAERRARIDCDLARAELRAA
jgi:hypothetical protein